MSRPPVLLALVLLALAGQGVARAQPSGAAAPTVPAQESATPPPPPTASPAQPTTPELDTTTLGDAGNAALDLFRGAAALGTVATCRTGSYGDDVPTLRDLTVTGELLDREADLKGLLDASIPWTKKGRPYDEDGCQALRHVLDQLRYRAEITETPVPDGVTVTIKLAPQTLVRHVKVEGNLSVLGIFGGDFRPIFATDIERRLRLQPGSPIADEPEERRLQLAEEEQRVVDYLSRRGQFDAEVGITTKDEGRHQIGLTVKIDRNSGYTVGRVTVAWRSGETELAAADALAAAHVTEEKIVETVDQRLCPFFFCGRGRFSYDQLQEDRDTLRQLFQKAGYPAVRVRIPYDPRVYVDRATKTVTLAIEVNLGKKLTVSFQGVENKSEQSLRDALSFDAANATDDYEAEASAEAIRDVYQGDGRFLTVVSFDRTRKQPSDACPKCLPEDEILFHIDEGPEQRIRGIGFFGNRSVPSATLADVILTRVYPTLPFSKGGYVTSVQLDQDLARLIQYYKSQGFPDVRVGADLANDPALVGALGATSAEVAADDAGSGLYIRYNIYEGAQQILESVGFAGNHVLSSAELAEAAQLHPGKPYTPGAITAAAARIKDRYDALGYRWVEVHQEIASDGPRRRVTLTVIEGARVSTGQVLVRGNFKTKRWVVRDNFDLRTGDLFSTEALEKGRANLRTTGLFTTVRTDVYPPPDRPGHDPQSLILEVGERYDRLADLDVGFGLSTDNSLFGSLTVAMRNLGGIGVSLSATGELGLLRTSVQSSLVFPEWVMKRAIALPVRLELQARYRLDQTPRFGSLTTLGFTISVSRQLAQGILLSVKYDWNRFGRSTELLRPAGNDQEISETPIDTTTALLGPTLLIDRRDNPLAPSRGYFVTASAGLASTALLGTDDFWKLDLLGQVFAPLGSRVILTNSLRWDQGFPLGGSVLLPEVERFSAGGDTTVRGYDTDRLATEIIKNPLAPASDAAGYRVVPIGRNIRVIHRLDLQLRLFDRVLGSIDIASALFLDSGLLTNSFADFDLSQIRQGLGVGLRIISAAGVISVEYAFPLQPRLGDDPTGRPDLLIGITL